MGGGLRVLRRAEGVCGKDRKVHNGSERERDVAIAGRLWCAVRFVREIVACERLSSITWRLI